MAKIALVNEFPEVLVALCRLITPGHTIIHVPDMPGLETLRVRPPDLMVVALFRHEEAFDRPITNFERDVAGAALLGALAGLKEFHAVPQVLFGIGVRPDDVPAGLPGHVFITFPQAIQELNPLISGLVGVAQRS